MQSRSALFVLGFLLVTTAEAAELNLDFAESPVDKMPAGFRSTFAGEGPSPDWRVILDAIPSAFPPLSPRATQVTKQPVLAQLSRHRVDNYSPLLIYEAQEFEDFTLTTKFKLEDGAMEQMAGIAFRSQDEKNFYYTPASGLGRTFYFFKVVKGVLSKPIGATLPIAKGVWHELVVQCEGPVVRTKLNGKEEIPPLTDTTFAHGKIGFWTKSDAVSYFAGTRMSFVPREILAQTIVSELMRKNSKVQAVQIYGRRSIDDTIKIIASNKLDEIGRPAGDTEREVIERGAVSHGKGKEIIAMTFPLHDNNGETVGAVKLTMKRFAGETEKLPSTGQCRS